MVMHARKQPRLSDGCNDRRDSQPYQTHKSLPKSQSTSLHRHDKMRDGLSDPTPPYKMLRRSDESPVNKQCDGSSKTKPFNTLRGTSCSPQDSLHNHSSNSHTKAPDTPHEPADDWSEHISSSGKRYYYNCRTEVSQWEKPKDWLEREQRQKDLSKKESNTFPKDRDYRREAVDSATTKNASGDKPSSTSAPSQSSSSSSNQGLNQASGSNPAPSSSSSTVPVSPSVQSQASGLLQDPALLRQLLPALQATLQMNNGSMDMTKINDAAQQASQSPVSLTSDASSPRSYLSPRNGTPQTNLLAQKPLLSMTPAPSQPKVTPVKPGPVPQQASAEKRPEDPRTLQQRSSQGSSPGHNGSASGSSSNPNAPSAQTSTPGSFTPSLASHFDENLIRHVQNWPAEHMEKQASRLREDAHNMGSLYMSEICTELKNLRSLVRVCEIQATLREQRILFLRQQSKELDKLKNQNSYMV
ncbi:WW domain-containing adapter protein with coiled-coil isoform X3 [Esox lucius]|uniref:WW domain-containing adapter protein with coiled-coil isoform X3 n=1 Tax=Esox lucius TaxID=8010 RepID=UPI00057616D7|nr:WW domain-containing adapter protein with coiled-coil isoform X3 [Esox lucius]